jgi:hypothetical protein
MSEWQDRSGIFYLSVTQSARNPEKKTKNPFGTNYGKGEANIESTKHHCLTINQIQKNGKHQNQTFSRPCSG